MPRVTVLIPVFNGAAYLEQTLQSVLNQTYQDFEILCIDDASTDNSSEIIKQINSPKIKYLKNEKNLGISGSRNRGLDLIQTEYIALLDHDDIAPSYRLEKEVEFLDNNPPIDVIGGNQKNIDEKGNVIGETWRVCHDSKYLKAFIMLSNTMANGSTMIRKKFLDKYQIRFQDNYCGVEDYRFWVDCSLKGRIANLDEVMLYWRTGHEQETYKKKKEKRKEREEKIQEIQRIALESNGFLLSENQYKLLFDIFGEDKVIINETQIRELFKVLKVLIMQAETQRLENTKEIKIMCRKRFGEKIGKCFFLWES